MYKALTIAGSDSGGGAGIQADLKTFQELGVFGMTAITALTAQNTLGVHGVYPQSLEAIEAQIEAVLSDLGADAVKTGMLFSADIIVAVANQLRNYDVKNVVVDPVMIAKGGAALLQDEAVSALVNELLPLATVITPNLPEAEKMIDCPPIRTIAEMEEAAKQLFALGPSYVLLKGGHLEEGEAIDLLYDGKKFTTYESERIDTKHTHGTGCTFAAAITAELAKGNDIYESVAVAKQFITTAIREAVVLGKGISPTNHHAYRSENEQMR